MVTKWLIVLEVDKELGRLAKGDPTEILHEDVKVQCRACGGVTVFPVLKADGVRPTPAPCFHCGADI